jgi:Tol biopolymer transport system component
MERGGSFVALAPGAKLGPYEIVAPLGAGGMGEVYRARDTRLGREVAVKVLPQHLSSNPEIRARFEREAKAVSSLNHPNVCVLHDVGSEDDTDYLVMELVEGETLAARLTRGALPLPDILKIGAQLADALDRAHRAGVVHRDLKPGNVMLTKAGAKLMDFGLARATGLSGPGAGSGVTAAALTTTPTVAQPLTAEGTIVGTFQYMSPEQLEGGETDARSDIWALGCVLYEMATGRRAFEGKSQASLIGSIMHADPAPMTQLAPMSPPSLERLVRQCLAKDPTERWQSAGDVRRELNWIATGMSQGSSPAPAVPRRKASPRGLAGLVAGGLIAVAALVYAFGPWHRAESGGRLMRFEIHAPDGTFLRPNAEAALSPDGSLLVFDAADAEGNGHIYVRSLANPDARALPGTDTATLPFWSPDGRSIAFFAKGKLFKVSLDGGAPIALCAAPDGRGGSWSADGTIVFAPNNQGPIARVSAGGGTPVDVTKVDASRGERGHRYPQFLPDGKHFLYVAVGKDVEVVTYVASLDGGEAKQVCKAGTEARFASPGYVIFHDQGVNTERRRFVAQKFDPVSLRVSGDPQLLLDPAYSTNFGYTNVTTDGRGTLVAEHSVPSQYRLSWVDRAGRSTGVAAQGIEMMGGGLSPDGKRFGYGGRDPSDLHVVDLGTGMSTRLTFENKLVNQIAWSPDGKTIAFGRITAEGAWTIYAKSADGTGPDRLLLKGPGMFAFPMDWSRDGRWIVARATDPTGNYDLWKIPIGGGAPEVYEHTPAQETSASLSPDGRWVLYTAVEGDKTELLVQSFPTPGTKYQVSTPGADWAAWSPTGEIVTRDGQGNVSAIQVSTAGGFHQGGTTRLFKLGSDDRFAGDVAPDGKSFLLATVTNKPTVSHLEVVLNWTKLIEKDR